MSTVRSQAFVKPTTFGEYIGMKPYPDDLIDFPGHIIKPRIPEFYFILGFATEIYDNGRGTGDFNPTWDVDYFSPEHIRALKQGHANAKVLISIGGVGTEYPFNPAERAVWSDHAIASLRQIINDYNKIIDGIDINYEVIKSNDIDFAHCIGQVIHGLRNEELIQVVSIAPSDQVQPHYRVLYEGHGNDIKWVNYKFYNQTVQTAAEFITLYHQLATHYHAKLLAGFSTDPNDRGVTLDVFLQGCRELHRTKSLPGIFLWNAHDSAAYPRPNENHFSVEEFAQNLLINPPH